MNDVVFWYHRGYRANGPESSTMLCLEEVRQMAVPVRWQTTKPMTSFSVIQLDFTKMTLHGEESTHFWGRRQQTSKRIRNSISFIGWPYYRSCLWHSVSSVCNVLYCGETVRPSEKVSEGVNRKSGSKSSFFWVVAIFLLPISPLRPQRRPFLPYFCPYSQAIGTRW